MGRNLKNVPSKSTKTRRLYITDSILNLLAINQHISDSAIVVRSIRDLSHPVLAQLEKYNEIVFWQKDKQLSFALARILNINRCSIISYSRSSYEAHTLDDVFGKELRASMFSLKDKSIVKFDDLEMSVKDEVENAKLYAGVQVSMS